MYIHVDPYYMLNTFRLITFITPTSPQHLYIITLQKQREKNRYDPSILYVSSSSSIDVFIRH